MADRTLTSPIVLTARAVLLDMDGTLVDSDAAVMRVWSRWALRHGLDPEHVFRVAHGRQGQETMAELLPDRPHEINLEENLMLLADEHSDLDGVIPIPGAPAFLAALQGVPHALVTSADDTLARNRMRAAGLDLPTIAVTAERVSASKPDPEGFLLGAGLLGVDPAECVVFEDSQAGIAAGLAAGMRVIGVGAAARELNPTVAVPDLTGVAVERVDAGVTLTIAA